MNTKPEMTLEQLAKRIDDQARFTRNVIWLCTLTVIGVLFFTLTEIFNGMPQAVILHYMANIEPIVQEWHAAETSLARIQTK